MKKILALVLALMMSMSLVACGNKDKAEKPAADAQKTEQKADAEKTDTTGTDTEDADTTGADADAATSSDWNDYADVFTVTYYGVTDADEAVAFVMTEKEDYAVMAVANLESMQSTSFVGEMTKDEATGNYTITDLTSNLALTFSAEFQDDNSVVLDLGDLGKMTVVPCEPSEAFELLNNIEAVTIPVA